MTININATICLYGNRDTGAGYLSNHRTPCGITVPHGAEVAKHRSFTDAVLLAMDDLRKEGAFGKVMVHDAGGERFAVVDLGSIPYYGNLCWKAA